MSAPPPWNADAHAPPPAPPAEIRPAGPATGGGGASQSHAAQGNGHAQAHHRHHAPHAQEHLLPATDLLAEGLTGLLTQGCQGRLEGVRWFKSTWQRGGGSTGFASFSLDAGACVPVVVKLPVGANELRWTTALGGVRHDQPPAMGPGAGPTPRVLASGASLGGYDLGWLVIERLPGKPLAAELSERDVHDMLGACAAVQGRCAGCEPVPARAPRTHDYARLLQQSKDAIKRGQIVSGHEQALWERELRHVHHWLGELVRRWELRPINAWCHGDLHAGNAMRRDDGRCALIDLALVHPGHWVEDAIYFERVYWGHEEYLHGVHAVSELAAQRRALGLRCTGDYGLVAAVRRVLSAMSAPALIEREGNLRYLHRALEVLQQYLPMAVH